MEQVIDLVAEEEYDENDMEQNYGGYSVLDDIARPNDEIPEPAKEFFKKINCKVISFHISGTDALNAAINYSQILKNAASLKVLHIGFYGASYGPLLTHGAEFMVKAAGISYNTTNVLQLPRREKYTQDYEDLQDYYTMNGTPMPDELLPKLTADETEAYERLRAALETGKYTALVLEPVWSTAREAYAPRLVRMVATACRETKTILIADECMTGVRCGASLFLWQWLGYTPDLVCFSKAFGLGGVLAVSTPERPFPYPQRIKNLLPLTTSYIDDAMLKIFMFKARKYTPEFLAGVAKRGYALRERLKALRGDSCCHEPVEGIGLLVYNKVNLKDVIYQYDRLLPLLDISFEFIRKIKRSGAQCQKCPAKKK